MSDLLIQAMAAKQSGDNKLAKQLLSQVILQNPRNEAAWMLMADVVDDVKLRRNCLEKVLAINPENSAASEALTKLNTTPLEAPFRAERAKPVEAPNADKTPPFTPPFTWDGKPEQYLALGDMTFPDIPNEEPNPLPETPPTFDWASESPEPDKTINKIFEAVSQPEIASEPPPQKEASWLDGLRPEEEILETPKEEKKAPVRKAEDPWLQELVKSDASTPPEPQALTKDDFSVSAEPELGLQAFAAPESAPIASTEPDSLLWDNPRARSDRLVILSYHSIICAHPSESEISNIITMFNENRMVRGLLGDNAHMIKLENIERVIANPKAANLIIEYKPNDKIVTHQFTFSSPQVRDEALTALKFRLGAGFKQSSRITTIGDKIFSPILILVLVAALTWGLVWGVPMASNAPTNAPAFQGFITSLMQMVTNVGGFWIILLAVIIAAACIFWMVLNLRKPSSEIILQR